MKELLIIGRNIRRIRRTKGWSQEKLAEQAGLHRTFVGAIERGERNISIATLVKLANALESSLVKIINNTNKS